MDQLFRQEALEFGQHRRQWGTVASLQPPPIKVAGWTTVLAAAVCVVFLSTAHYARKETVAGFLTPTRGTSKIFVARPGIISSVFAKEGDFVKVGQVLLGLDYNQLAGDGSDVNAALLSTLHEQRDRLASNIEAEIQRAQSEKARIEATIGALETELLQLSAQREIQSMRIDVARRALADASALIGKGYITTSELTRRKQAKLEQEQALSALVQQSTAKTSELEQARYNLSQLPTLMDQRVQALRNQLADVEQRATEVRGRTAQMIKAPVRGRVTSVQAKPGQAADPRRLQMEIVPEDSVLNAELLVPARAIGLVEVGQPVRILYDAFPYQHFGAYGGKVSSVSHTLLTAADAGGPISLEEPAYRVIATLDQSSISANGKPIPLQPDMLLKADIILERRLLIDWLLQPFRSVRM